MKDAWQRCTNSVKTIGYNDILTMRDGMISLNADSTTSVIIEGLDTGQAKSCVCKMDVYWI
jgi:hypothetical protein